MKKILFIDIPYSAHINCSLGLIKKLINRKYEVGYINAPKYKNLLKPIGANFIPYNNFSDNMSQHDENVNLYYAAYTTALGIGAEYDLIIYDMNFFLGEILAEKLKKPSVRQSPMIAIDKAVKKDLIKKSPFWFPTKYEFINRMSTKRKAKGIKTKTGHYLDEIIECVPQVNIFYTAKEFQPNIENFDDRFYFVGPSIHHQNEDIDLPFKQKEYPIIYISLGTLLDKIFKDEPIIKFFSGNLSLKVLNFFRTCIEAFRDKKVNVVITLGDKLCTNPFEQEQLPDNIFVFKYVPQLAILKKSSLFITHCGMNSVNEAMTCGVPMLGAPFFWDQMVNCDQIEKLNLGRRIKCLKILPEKLYESAMSIIDDRVTSNDVLKMKEIMSKYNGSSMAADIIENYIGETYYYWDKEQVL